MKQLIIICISIFVASSFSYKDTWISYYTIEGTISDKQGLLKNKEIYLTKLYSGKKPDKGDLFIIKTDAEGAFNLSLEFVVTCGLVNIPSRTPCDINKINELNKYKHFRAENPDSLQFYYERKKAVIESYTIKAIYNKTCNLDPRFSVNVLLQ